MNIIIGCGYLGRQLCAILPARSPQQLRCLVQNQTSADGLIHVGLPGECLDLDQISAATSQPEFSGCDIYFFAPPSSIDCQDHRMQSFLDLCAAHVPRRIVYVSTSGVYGDCGGAWVDETQTCKPLTERAKRRLHAEQSLIRFCAANGCQYMILRVGGIYGPERIPLQRLHDITVVCPQEAPYSNRIHVADLAQVCLSAMQTTCYNHIFNVADGQPTSMSDYFFKIAEHAGLPEPNCVPLAQAEQSLSPAMLSFISESKRLRIDKMLELLKVKLAFPDLQSGLTDCFEKLNTR